MPSTHMRPAKAKAATKLPPRSLIATPRPGKEAGVEPQRTVKALSSEERWRLIAQAAYYRAEKRGFAPGGELQDWVEAEAEVQRMIGSA